MVNSDSQDQTSKMKIDIWPWMTITQWRKFRRRLKRAKVNANTSWLRSSITCHTDDEALVRHFMNQCKILEKDEEAYQAWEKGREARRQLEAETRRKLHDMMYFTEPWL